MNEQTEAHQTQQDMASRALAQENIPEVETPEMQAETENWSVLCWPLSALAPACTQK